MSCKEYAEKAKLHRAWIVYGFIKDSYPEHDKIPIELISILILFLPLREKLTFGNKKDEYMELVNATTAKCTSNKMTALGGKLIIGKGDVHVWKAKFVSSTPISRENALGIMESIKHKRGTTRDDLINRVSGTVFLCERERVS